MTSPTCFVSYSWESEDHKSWVRDFASDLQKNGVHVYLDQWDLRPGADLTKYMESSIRESDFVLLICTPAFAQKANEGKGGVGYEKSIVTGEIFSNSSGETKFVPILKSGNVGESLPSYLKSRLFADFSARTSYHSSLTELLRHIFDSPEFERPPIGRKPNFETINNRVTPEKEVQKNEKSDSKNSYFDLGRFKELVEYASDEYNGLSYEKDDAAAWAQNNLNLDLDKFKELVEYASDEYSGLNYTKDDAVSWALNKI